MKLKTFLFYLASAFSFGVSQGCFAADSLEETVDQGLLEEVDSISTIKGALCKSRLSENLAKLKSDAVSFSGSLAVKGVFSDIGAVDYENLNQMIKTHPGSSNFFENGLSFSSRIRGEFSANFDTDLTYGSFGVDFSTSPFKKDLSLGLFDAFFGFRSSTDDALSIAFEVGRQRMSNLASSPLQYDSVFDGVFLKSSMESESGLGAKVGFGGFLIDVGNFHFGQLFDMTIGTKNCYINYSMINWKLLTGEYRDSDNVVVVPIDNDQVFERLENIEPINVSYAYTNSQISFGFNLENCLGISDVYAYLGALMNHAGVFNDAENAYNRGLFAGINIGGNTSPSSLLLQFFYVEPLSIKESDFAAGSSCSNSLSKSAVSFAESGNPFLSQVNVMGPRAVLSFTPFENIKFKLDASYIVPIIGNLPNKTQASIEMSYSF